MTKLNHPSCPNHNPVQHRDGKAPWCKDCGLTSMYQRPDKGVLAIIKRKESGIPNEASTKLYRGDPETEDLIYGDRLENGMIVLIESPIFKRDIPADGESVDEIDLDIFLKENYWCRVTNLRLDDGVVQFIGEYSDGHKASRRYDKSWAWHVKKESM